MALELEQCSIEQLVVKMKSFILLTIICSSIWAARDEGCNHTWYIGRDGDCVCGSELNGRLRCNDLNQTVEITAGFCMTFDAN